MIEIKIVEREDSELAHAYNKTERILFTADIPRETLYNIIIEITKLLEEYRTDTSDKKSPSE